MTSASVNAINVSTHHVAKTEVDSSALREMSDILSNEAKTWSLPGHQADMACSMTSCPREVLLAKSTSMNSPAEGKLFRSILQNGNHIHEATCCCVQLKDPRLQRLGPCFTKGGLQGLSSVRSQLLGMT